MKRAHPIRIVCIIDNLGLGGAQRQLLEITKALPREKYDIYIISMGTDKTQYVSDLEEAKIPYTLIAQSGKWDWNAFGRLLETLRGLQPQVIYTWLFTSDTYGRLAGLFYGKARILSAMRNTIDDMPWHYRLVSRWLSWITSRITVNANAIKPGMTKTIGIPEKKLLTIYNGIDLGRFPQIDRNGHYHEEWNIPTGACLVAMIARMAEQKDHETFIRAASKVIASGQENVYFILVGDGPLRKKYEILVGELGIADRVRFAGARRDIWELLNHIELFVLSTLFEGCSNVIMEAMAAGKPVIATAVGGNPELIENGKTGYLVPERDADALSDRICHLLADSEKAAKMGAQGRRRIENEFSLERTVAETAALYDEVV